MTHDIASITQASHTQAQRLLEFLDQTEVEPQVASISLMMAAAMLIGSLAIDQENLLVMSAHMRDIFAARAREFFATYNADSLMTRN
jgi:hypothetical protein